MSGKPKNMKLSFKSSIKRLQKVCSKIIEFGIKCRFKIASWDLPGRSQSLLLRQPPESQKASPGSLCVPRAPLMSPWLPLGTAQVPPKAILAAWRPQMSGFRRFWQPKFDTTLKNNILNSTPILKASKPLSLMLPRRDARSVNNL